MLIGVRSRGLLLIVSIYMQIGDPINQSIDVNEAADVFKLKMLSCYTSSDYRSYCIASTMQVNNFV